MPFSEVLIRAGYASYTPLHLFPHKAWAYSILARFVYVTFFSFASVSSNRSGTHGLHRKRRVRTRAQR